MKALSEQDKISQSVMQRTMMINIQQIQDVDLKCTV